MDKDDKNRIEDLENFIKRQNLFIESIKVDIDDMNDSNEEIGRKIKLLHTRKKNNSDNLELLEEQETRSIRMLEESISEIDDLKLLE